MQRNVISILVADRFGALPRIAEAFGSRMYNVVSICSGSCEEPECQRLTIVCFESKSKIEKIIKILQDLIDVYHVKLVTSAEEISKEMMLAKVSFKNEEKEELLTLLKKNNAEIIYLKDLSVTFEVAKSSQEIDKLCNNLLNYKIIEMARTGEAAIHR